MGSKVLLTMLLVLRTALEATSVATAGKEYVNVSGDLMLGALFPIHRLDAAHGICGHIQGEDGVQPLEALIYTIDRINKDDSILPNITLGFLALDTCDSNVYAAEQALDFFKGFIARSNEHHTQEFQCSDGSIPRFRNGKFDKIIGVIGGQSSSVSIQVATILRMFRMPQISYMSTSPVLSDRFRFPYFLRTVPSDINRTQVIFDILRYFNWTYTTVVYSDSEYGVHSYETLKDFAVNESICFTSPQRVSRFQFTEHDYRNVIRSIKKKPDLRVIILILEKEYVMRLLKASKTVDPTSDYVWLGTEGWSSRESVALGNEDILEGAIAVQPLATKIRDFDEYFTNLTLEHTRINPWFQEYWEDYFGCTINTTSGQASFDESFTPCSVEDKISTKNFNQHSFVHFIRDSVYAYAHALHNLQKDLCPGKPGICPEMEHIDGPLILDYLKKVSFKDEDGNDFHFDQHGNGPIRYTIVNFQNGGWKNVGNYSRESNGTSKLMIELSKMKYRSSNNGTYFYPISTCAHPCGPLQIKMRKVEDACCWTCKSCSIYQIRLNESVCEDCELGMIPDNETFSTCVPIAEAYVNYRNPLGLGAMAIAGLGILLTLFTAVVFRMYSETPVIKAAGRELSCILLVGIFLSFCFTFITVAEPSRWTCSLMRFFVGFCPTLCYSAILTKTNRIARIFYQKGGPMSPKPKFISPRSQMVIVSLLTLVEIIINFIWITIDRPNFSYAYPSREVKLKICEGVDSYDYMIGLIYPLVLVGFCTLYAVQTRKCPGGFNETRYIAFTNYSILITWLAFVPLYLASANYSIRVITLAASMSFSGMVELTCLFFPKLYIVLIKPEKNTKEVVMAPNRSSFGVFNDVPTDVSSSHKQQLNGKYSSNVLMSDRLESNVPVSDSSF